MNINEAGGSKSTKPDNIAVLGNWGIGKTSTLQKFRDILHNEMKDSINAFSVLFSLKPSICEDADVFTSCLLDAISKQYSTSIPLKRRVGEVIKEEAKIWEQWKINSISMSPELRRKTKEHSLLDALGRLWGKLENSGIDLAVIMMDDIHYLITDGWKGSLYDLRTDIQTLSADGARYLFVITGPIFIYPEMHELAEPFTRLFEKFELVNFDLSGTKEAITKPLEVSGVPLKISDDVVEQIHKMTEGHPFFIASIMRDILRIYKEGDLTPEKFEGIRGELISHLARSKFQDDYDIATDAEKLILLRCAKLGKEVFSPSDIEGKSQPKLFERLGKKELLIKISRGKYRLYHPLFAEYLRSMEGE